jgi:alpha-L-fucosidase 2
MYQMNKINNKVKLIFFQVVLLLGIIFSCPKLPAQSKIPNAYTKNIDWPLFMSRHDLIWEELPLQWNEGAFVGNGQIGMMIYVNKKDNNITFHIGRQDVTEHRKAPDKKSSIGVIGANGFTDFTRFDIGKMTLRPTGKILSCSIRQSLWNAEIKAHFVTDAGSIDLVASCPYTSNVNVVEVVSTEKTNKATSYEWLFQPGRAFPPRMVTRGDSANYERNPLPVFFEKDGYHYCEQTLNAGGDYATVWKEKVGTKSNSSIFYMSIANEIPAAKQSAIKGKQYIDEVMNGGLEKAKSANRNWWHAFYQKSFLSIPDAKMESFYWIQLYKMATCSRPDAPAVDLFGPYFRVSTWPFHWWNLNIQLTYWPVYASNHLELGENYISIVDDNFETLLNRRQEKTLGDFAWAMHNYYWQYSYAGDWKSLKEKWLPKAEKIAEAYQSKLVRNAKGQLEMMPLGSPEYKGFEVFPNTNYNLALLRWLLNTIITVNQKTKAGIKDETVWKKILADLIPYPVDANGLMIGSNQSVDMSHRHFSHLLALYPLFQLNPDNTADKDLVVKSVKHWHQIENGKALAGYSFTGASLLYTSLGMGNEALDIMHQFLGDSTHSSRILTNTFYTESGGKNPVIETPLSGAAGVIDFLLQSWGNKIRIFPAMPDTWKEASFDQLRAEGGFLVTASRKQGKTQFVHLKSLAGEPCIVKINDWKDAYTVDNKIKVSKTSTLGEFVIHLEKGQEVLLLPNKSTKPFMVVPVQNNKSLFNAYGVKKGQQLDNDQFWIE